ncbi:peptidoglycan DD-metalloendopeptidase family protein [Litoreibacter albidus]|uniref:Transglycosylase SLT domain-containing protein n=1 Tax=Litoreibacter albidus TaxID=670155 RepID=A0A1H3D9Q9_9RHOB|nr:M23 family metallopeptidase [Litoreibacter albidus]SDX63173.1 Transglycosylase SLT domain-containing protein [Litoreibacter albidus]
MEIDPRFKQAKKKSSRRKFRQKHGPALLIGGGVLALGVLIAGVVMSGFITISAPPDPANLTSEELAENLEGLDEDLEEDITATSTADALAYASAFADVAGDPMVLRFDASLTTKSKPLPSHPDLPLVRVGRFAPDTLVLVQDDMITRQEKLITTLPSSREEFAFFQAQRSQSQTPAAATPASFDVPDLDEATTDTDSLEGDSWGESVDGEDESADTYTQTVIENTTSLTIVKRENQRKLGFNDLFLRLKGNRPLVDILTDNGFDADAAKAFQEKGLVHIAELAELPSDYVLAVRSVPSLKGATPVQLSLYTRDTYIGSIALEDDGSVVQAADPWVQDELFSYAEDDGSTDTVSARKYRLLDAFYSAGIRNGVPTSVVGESIVLLSQDNDLEAFATTGDRMTLLYAREPGPNGAGPGQVLYAAIEGPSGDKICYVAQVPGEGFKCFKEKGEAGPSGRGANGMVTPVSGVLTSPFGPRFHPILKKVKVHHGVDWAAPSGTPILAAFDGRVSFAGNGGGYGNVIKVAHAGGRETRYAHMSKFSPLGKVGTVVRAGDVIGFVGTTGRSTGPHLHFELRERGQSLDPFTAPPVGAAPVLMASASNAVESLVNQIIRVESAGNARAKNTRSSATGLGQFISSTWIRMMKTYRPDLASTMSREELLKLRFDPTLSREMVTNLAREGEAYLRARGHAITAGRLYLCHFLGAQGAHVALSAPDQALILDVMGAGVIKANPFLKGRDIAWVKNWAERKMNRKGGPVAITNAAPAIVRIPPEVAAYKKTIKAVLELAG